MFIKLAAYAFGAYQAASLVVAVGIVSARPVETLIGLVAVGVPVGLGLRAYKAIRRARRIYRRLHA